MAVTPDEALSSGRAFGIDPTRPERYSLRQSRYEALASDISAWAGEAAARGETLSLLDIGCGWGPLLRYGSEAAAKSRGAMRVEGKDYVVQDGDVMHFLFNV